jgi:hypothetical protein
MIVLGLIVLVAAIVVGMAGVLSNHGSAHTLNHGFALLGYHVTGSTGRCSSTAWWSGRWPS